MATLVPCAACARHVRNDETTCPFCEAPVQVASLRELGAMPRDRLLARTALTFATAAAMMACGKEPAEKPVEPHPNVAPAYGVPVLVVPDAAVELAPSSSASVEPPPTDAGYRYERRQVPMYGMPPNHDGSRTGGQKKKGF